jgi:hypothetical protein
MKTRKDAECLNKMMKIIDFDNFLGISSILAKFLKGYLDNKGTPLLEKRAMLRGELENFNN